MNLNKRELIGLSIGTAGFVAITGKMNFAYAAAEPTIDDLIKTFTGGAAIEQGKVNLTSPQIAESGYTVPISVRVDSPMSADNFVVEVMILADGNPNPEVATFKFSALSGTAEASIRIRLAKTQNILAIAKMNDGTYFMAKNAVEVTIGGCGS